MPLDNVAADSQKRARILKRFGYKMRFPGQHAGEETILTIRRTIFAFLGEIFTIFGALILPIGIYLLLRFYVPDLLDPPNSQILVLVLSLYALFCSIYFFVVWIDRYFDVWVVTNERLIDVEQKSFFNRVTSELEFDKIQDVTVEVKGVLQTLFRFGSVFVQTAGTHRNFHIQDVGDPHVVKDVIVELERAYIESHPTVAVTQTIPPTTPTQIPASSPLPPAGPNPIAPPNPSNPTRSTEVPPTPPPAVA